MPDVWSQVRGLDDATQARLAGVLETRGADSQQQAMRRAFLSEASFENGAKLLDVGCGTGVLTRILARWPGVAQVTAVDPVPSLLAKARDLARGVDNVEFLEGDAGALEFPDGSFDAVVFDSVFSHLPSPLDALHEAARVLRGGGTLAVFDGDYATTTVALDSHDPLQLSVQTMMANSVTDRWIMRKLAGMAARCGFVDVRLKSHGYIEQAPGSYMRTIVERGIDLQLAGRLVDEEGATAMKALLQRRIDAGEFFGHIAYASLIATRP